MLRSILYLTVAALAACGHADDEVELLGDAAPGCDGACVDAPAADDAGSDAAGCFGTCPAIDAGAGDLPINAACEPTLDQCELGLTCRIRAAHDGLCRPVGAVPAGGVCTSVDQCGANLACVTAAPGTMRCMVVCDVAAPSSRCVAGETCTPYWGADTGVCT